MNEKSTFIINYGMGNLRSVENAIKKLGFNCKIVSNPEELNSAQKIILPGVGSFKTAMHLLNSGAGLIRSVNVLENKKPFWYCLGMQLLADSSEEFGLSEGLKNDSGSVKNLGNLGANTSNLEQCFNKKYT